MKNILTIALCLIALTGYGRNNAVQVNETNSVVTTPTNFFTANDIARKTAVDATNAAQDVLIGSKASTNTTDALAATNTAQDLSIASKVSTNNPVFLAAITNLLSSGTAVSVTNLGNGTWQITVIASTGTAASVGADLDDHKTNDTAHLALFAGKAGTNDIPDFGTNAAFLSVSNAAINAYPSSNPSNYVTATITNGLGGTFNHTALTNLQGDVDYQHISTARVALIDSALQAGATQGVAYASDLAGYLPTSTVYVAAESDTNALTQLHSITGRVAMALTNESDTLPSILDRSLFASNSVGRTVNILGSPSPVSFVVPQSWYLEFGNLGGRTNFLGVDAADYFIRVNADGTAYRMHDDDSFVAGVDYLAPSGSGASLTGITAGQAGAVSTNGGTLNGPLLTTVDQIATAPSSDELVTAGWARNIMSSGKAIYMTTNLFNAQWTPTNTTGIGSYVNGDQQWVSFSVTGVNHYVASLIDTNPIPANTPLVGPATVHIHLGLVTGSPAINYGFSAKPELYYTYDLAATSLSLGDFDAEPQAWTAGTTNSKTFTLAWPNVTPTNTYYRAFRLKCTAKGSATTNVIIGVGGTDSSFVQIQQSTADYTLTAAGIAAAGGVTNRVYVTATPLDCSPTTTITRAMIDAAPWGEMSLALTQACYLTFDATVTGTVDVATFALYLSGTNALTWNTNQLTGTAWTNATATGSDRIFRKAARAGTVAIW